MKVSKKAKLIKRVQKMELNNPIIQTLIGLVVFYIGLKMFSGGMKSMGNIDHLQWFLGNPIYMFFGGIVMTLLWQSSSLLSPHPVSRRRLSSGHWPHRPQKALLANQPMAQMRTDRHPILGAHVDGRLDGYLGSSRLTPQAR